MMRAKGEQGDCRESSNSWARPRVGVGGEGVGVGGEGVGGV